MVLEFISNTKYLRVQTKIEKKSTTRRCHFFYNSIVRGAYKWPIEGIWLPTHAQHKNP